jgi:hypothetical protein
MKGKKKAAVKKAVKKIVQSMPKKQKSRPKSNTFGKIIKGVGSVANSFLPGAKFLSDGIASIIGSGDYVTNSELINGNSITNGTSPPQFKSPGGSRATTISHREYLTDVSTGPTLVNGQTSFNYNTYNINPALAASFPWLATIAQNFEEYEILGMVYEFKSTSANALNSTNTALGTVIMSSDYNVLNPPFASKLQQENYELAQSVKPSESCLHAVECARPLNVNTHLYTRSGAPPTTSSDLRLYDLGQFQISTVGMQAANVNIGELWVTYHVSFYKPKIASISATSVVSDLFHQTTYTNSVPFGAASNTYTPVAGSTIGSTIVTGSGGGATIMFPSTIVGGTFLIEMSWAGTTAQDITTPVLGAVSGCTVTAALNSSQTPSNGGVACLTCYYRVYVSITAANATLGYNVGSVSLPTGPANCNVWISSYNSALPFY